MAVYQKIGKVGGSCKVTLPKQLFDLLDWEIEDRVKIMASESNLILINIDLEERKKNGKKDFFR